MKKLVVVLTVLAVVLLATGPAAAQKVKGCTTIPQGTLTYSAGHYLAGQPFATGFDPYGYNYQAHMFEGSYFNAYAGGAGFPPYEGDDAAYLAVTPSAESHWAWPYRNDQLAMKWNDAWLSNQDCDSDGTLDRRFGFTAYFGSGAWLTNHQKYEGAGGTYYNYFVKIVAPPSSANLYNGIWYTSRGQVIGPSIWGEFAIIQEVTNDPDFQNYRSPAGPGLGKWK